MTILIRCDLCGSEDTDLPTSTYDLPDGWVEMPTEQHVCGVCASHIDATLNNPGSLHDFKVARGGVDYPSPSEVTE